MLRTWFYVSAPFLFAFWGSEKHVFHIVPFRPTRYVLKSFRTLEVSNRERNKSNVKNNISVRSKILLFQLDIPILINKLMGQSSLINSVKFVFCEFNREVSWYEGNTYILALSQFQIPNRNTGFIFKFKQCQCKHVFS